jgi:hypothetical protein
MKKCKAKGCDNFVFSHGFCQRHSYLRTDEKYLQRVSEQRSRKKWYKIPPVSEKRSQELKTYSSLCKQMDKEAKANGSYVCFFCGELIEGRADHHHLDGKENSRLTDSDMIVLAHRDCHRQYHDLPVAKIKWYLGFLDRLKKKDPALFWKEAHKQYKV